MLSNASETMMQLCLHLGLFLVVDRTHIIMLVLEVLLPVVTEVR